MEGDIVISLKEYKRYQSMINTEDLITKPDAEYHESNKNCAGASISHEQMQPLLEPTVRLRESEDYYAFHALHSEDSVSNVTHTILPSKLLPTKPIRRKQIKPEPELPEITTYKTRTLVQRTTSHLRPPLVKRETKSRLQVEANTTLPEIAISEPSASIKSGVGGKQKRLRKQCSQENGARVTTPKIITNEPDLNNYSIRNIEESEPGTVRLSIYYHEPPKKLVTLKVGGEEFKAATPIKGLIFDKNGQFYYPPDPGPVKRKGPSLSSLGSVAEVILFKIHLDHCLRKNADHKNPKMKFVKAGKKLRKIKNIL